jgi:uncharacterized membrane protein
VTNEVEKGVEIAAPVSEVFAYVDDFRTVPEWLYGISKFEPVGDQDQGLGAVYDAEMMVGVKIKTRIEIVKWEHEKVIALRSIKGFQTESEWTIESMDDGRTRLSGHLSYDLPLGLAGKAMAKAMEPAVKIAVRKSSEAIVRNIEARSER